jgi:predicted nucleic acid-binding protein
LSEPRSVAYADASALAKLVLEEPEAALFAGAFTAHDRVLTSVVGAVELERAARRARGEQGARQVSIVVDRLTLVPVTDDVRRAAATLAPAALRTVDAIHLASALGPGVTGPFYCYDRRLCEAAAAAGLRVESPGSSGP